MSLNQHELQFRQWIDEHSGLLLKVVWSFVDRPDDADDLFQEILLQVWLSLPNFQNGSKATTWLYRVAFNTALAWKRTDKKRRGREQPFSGVEVLTQPVGPADVQRNDCILDQLYQAIRELQPPKRALLVLYLDGFTYREIAEVLGISESNVGATLNRIKSSLAARLKEDER